MPPRLPLWPAAPRLPAGPQGAMKATTGLTVAEVRALHTTPQQIVPAVTGKTIMPYFVVFQTLAQTIAYSADQAGNIGWTSVPASFQWAAPVLYLNAHSAPFALQLGPAGPEEGGAAADIQSQPLYLSLTADVTLGDGSALVTTFYEVI